MRFASASFIFPEQARVNEANSSEEFDCSISSAGCLEDWLRGLDLNQRPSGYEASPKPETTE
jgi:hypothetical protein